MVKNRYLQASIQTLCFPRHKMAFISGPRQCGKTTMAKRFLKARGVGEYFNWDEKSFRAVWAKQPLASVASVQTEGDCVPMVIFDEIHKAKGWKRNLKGIYDSLESPIDILVTGSAKLNTYRRTSDSLLGRYHHFRLHPFSVAELLNNRYTQSVDDLIDLLFSKIIAPKNAEKYTKQLLEFGPFPDPLFEQNNKVLRLWQSERIERLIREDLRDLTRIQELSQIEMLVSLLPARAANVLSITSLREDLEVSYATMKLWIEYLKAVYYLFEIKPYSKAIPRGLKKEGKVYLYDWSEITDEGARFENMIACHLLKYVHFLCDTGEAKAGLHCLKNKQKQEIDFLITKNDIPWLPIEIKLSDESLSPNWRFYLKHLPCKKGIQIVKTPGIRKIVSIADAEVLVISAADFLSLLV